MKIVTIQIEIGIDDQVDNNDQTIANYINDKILNNDIMLWILPENIVNIKEYT